MNQSRMHDEALAVYDCLKSVRKRIGEFHQGAIHVHTPASHDYRLLQSISENETYEKLTEQQIYDECCKLSSAFRMQFTSMGEFYAQAKSPEYGSFKEQLAFYCMALQIINLRLKFIVVSDHNTLSGCMKLDSAIRDLADKGRLGYYVNIIHGIEISCADKMHVIVIFDKTDKKSCQCMAKWLDENLVTEKDGSFQTSLEVLKVFKSSDYITYLAHVNTSSLFNERFLSLAYKKTLLGHGDACLLGTKDIGKVEKTRELVNSILADRECLFITDNDAHCIQELSLRNSYVMGSSIDFRGLKAALLDYDVSFEHERTQKPNAWIQGIGYIADGDSFFCESQTHTDRNMLLSFSPEMNCLIGGRGSGKSTIINTLDLLLGGKGPQSQSVEMICRHPAIYILFCLADKEYMVLFSQPSKQYATDSYDEHIINMRRMQKYKDNLGRYHQFQDSYSYLQENNVELFELVDVRERKWCLLPKSKRRAILSSIFDDSYSINEIVSFIGQNKTSELVLRILCKNKAIKKAIEKNIEIGYPLVFSKVFSQAMTAQEARRKVVEDTITSFNNLQKGEIAIECKMAENINEYLSILFPEYSSNLSSLLSKYNIRLRSLKDYFYEMFEQLGAEVVLNAIHSNNAETLCNHVPLSKYADQQSKETIDSGRIPLDESNQEELLQEILRQWGQDDEYMRACLIEFLKPNLLFSLSFNIASNQLLGSTRKEMRDISKLSMGQKVVAALTLILSYSDFVEDMTPLIIDQPEDNLDSQYIYQTLVQELRRVKRKRQVIIATHNSTLVTNTKAEQVVVLKSDSGHAWIENSGYPTNRKIAHEVLQYLEGGRKSFKHRFYVYREHLRD